MDQLLDKAVRDGLSEDAESLRLPADRHVEGAKRKIDEWEETGEVLVESLCFRRVVPAMKHGAGNDEAQRTERPVDVGVQHERVERQERDEGGERAGTEP